MNVDKKRVKEGLAMGLGIGVSTFLLRVSLLETSGPIWALLFLFWHLWVLPKSLLWLIKR